MSETSIDTSPKAADARFKANDGDESVIPAGSYCYTPIRMIEEPGRPPRMKIKHCPYWGHDFDKPRQQTGYCALLGQGDWDPDPNGPFLLWDQVKECGLNDDDDEDEEGLVIQPNLPAGGPSEAA